MTESLKIIFIICKRELAEYFTSPIAYVFIIGFLLLSGFFTFAAPPFGNFLNTNDASLIYSFFSFQPWLFLILVPPIAMNMWSEEFKTGTVELLRTLPISITEAVIGKFLAAWIIIAGSLILTFPLIITVNCLGNPDNGIIAAGYLGSFLLAGSYLSIACMTSALTKNQIISFILSVVICLIIALAGHPSITNFFINWAPVWLIGILSQLSILPHVETMQKGILDCRDILYFISVVFFFLFFTSVLLKIRYCHKLKKTYSSIGVMALLVILININFLDNEFFIRKDITENKIFTLSESTKNILGNLKKIVTIRYYRTSNNDIPISMRLYAKRVEDLLDEYIQSSPDKIILEKYNPLPDTSAESSAIIDGISGQTLRNGNKFFLGLNINYLNNNSTISFLSPAAEKTLEYSISKGIYDVSQFKKPSIGLLSSMPVMGSISGFTASKFKRKTPWIFIQELQKEFDITELSYDTEIIENIFDILLVVHPEKLSNATKFAIDQYLLKGGKLFIFVDPYCFAASVSKPDFNLYGAPPEPSASNLPDLFSAWGIKFSKSKEVVIAPEQAYHALNDPLGKEHPAILNITPNLMNQQDIIISGLNRINLVFSGAFSVNNPKKTLKYETLLNTSPNSELFKNFSYKLTTADIMAKFNSGLTPLNLMMKVTGKFKTAFPDGQRSSGVNEEEKFKNDNSLNRLSSESLMKNNNILKNSSTPGTVILVGDADILFNSFCVSKQNANGQSIINVINSNLDLIRNSVDQLTGDQNIISIRTRGSLKRTFTEIEKLYKIAKKKYQFQVNILEKQLNETETFLNELQSTKSEDSKYSLSSEQLKAVYKFRKKEKSIKRELTQVRKQLRLEVDNLKTIIEIINIAVIPILLTIFGIILSMYKRCKKKKRKAS